VLDYLNDLGQDQVFLITDKDGLEEVREIGPDLILSVGFRSIVPKEVLALPPLGAINFHKSLLPLHRGANPVFWTVLKNTRAGVSIHYMDEGIDTGRIIAQKELAFGLDDKAETLYRKLEELQLELFREVWPRLRLGEIQAFEQEGEPTYHVINDFKELRKIDEDKTVKVSEFINYLRAMTFPPFNNAYIERDGKRYFVEISIKQEESLDKPEKKTTLLKQYQ